MPSAQQAEGIMETLVPLILLWALPLYIAGGFLGLLQFKLVYTALTNAAAWRSKLWIWQQVRPGACLPEGFELCPVCKVVWSTVLSQVVHPQG